MPKKTNIVHISGAEYLPTTGADQPATAQPNVHQRRFMGFAELVGRTGLGDLTQRTAIDRLRLLHTQGHMPLPRSPRFVRRQLITGARSICAASLWDRGQILEWLETGYVTTPPEDGPRVDQQLLRQRLAQRAASLIAPRQHRVGG